MFKILNSSAGKLNCPNTFDFQPAVPLPCQHLLPDRPDHEGGRLIHQGDKVGEIKTTFLNRVSHINCRAFVQGPGHPRLLADVRPGDESRGGILPR